MRFIDFLSKTSLNNLELKKVNSLTGESRIDILLRMILNGEPLTLKNGQRVVIDKEKSKKVIAALQSGDEETAIGVFKNGTKYANVLVGKNGVEYKLTDFLKSQEFGGGTRGIGGGAEQTDVQEGAQAIALANSTLINSPISEEDLTLQNAKRVQSLFKIKTPLEKAVEIFQDKSWANSFVITTNSIREKFNIKGKTFHHQDEWVKQLEKAFDFVNKDQKGRIFSNRNKWNPSDIWIVGPEGERIPSFNNIVQLNAWLLEMFEKQQIIGLSLKKVGKTANISVHNVTGNPDELLNLTIQGLLTSKTNQLFNSKDSFILYERKEVQFRSFEDNAQIQGEIKGKYAAHGKIGFGSINRILDELGLDNVMDKSEIMAKLRNNKIAVIKEIYAMALKVNPTITKQSEEDFVSIVNNMSNYMLTSKFQAVQLVYILSKAPKNIQNAFIQKLIGIASSRSALSSVFVKIS